MKEHGTARRGRSGARHTRLAVEAVAVFLVAVAMTGITQLGACASNATSSFLEEAGAEASVSFDAGVSSDSATITPSEDSGFVARDAAPPPACPGSALPEDAASGACLVDMSEGCPSCASWGFACGGGGTPKLQAGSASSSCHATPAEDGGLLICCTQPACAVTTIAGACDASTQTRYECNPGAVPTGTCEWQGAGAPNDYCCQ